VAVKLLDWALFFYLIGCVCDVQAGHQWLGADVPVLTAWGLGW
jgi:hypothetical protein